MSVRFRSLVSLLVATGAILALLGDAAAQDEGRHSSVASVEAQLARWQAEKARVEAELEGLVAERTRAQAALRDRARMLYRLHRRTGIGGGGALLSRLQHRSRTERLGRRVVQDLGALAELQRRSAALRDRASELAGRIDEGQGRLEALRIAEEARRRQEAAAAGLFGHVFDVPYGAEADPYGMRIAGETPGAAFARLQGRLPMPIAGSTTLRAAEREGGQGVEVAAGPGHRVRAVAAGRVAYAAAHPSFGPLIVLDHGGGYYTVYGGLAALRVSAGDRLAASSVLGLTGVDPIFFQVRRGTRPLPTERWLGL